MADYNVDEISELVKADILSESQGVGDVPVVSSLEGINSLPALKNGNEVVEAPLSLLAAPAEEAAEKVYAAIEDAEDTASHPTYIGEDNYVYKWNKTTKSYDKTAIYVRGEGFKISKTYNSIDQMEADTAHGLKEGDFVLINTNDVENPDNAKIYVVDAEGAFEFLVDMSGAIGFTGKTPQLFIGTVNIGSGKDSAAVTLSYAGTDSEGNPKYDINYIIPCLAYEDLTAEQIADLQKPAKDMIVVLEKTNTDVQAAEDLRVKAENDRVEEFDRLKAESETATSNAVIATDAANAARDSANEAAESARKATTEANDAKDAANIAAENATKATEDANDAASEARNTPKIQGTTWWVWDIENGDYVDTGTPATSKSPKIIDGIWWTWDDVAGEYVNTGWAVDSDFELTKEKIEGALTGDIETHTHEHVRYRALVYEETPDFATLTTWEDEFGVHQFHVGHDIYVKNDTEPSGYANYKLAHSVNGNVWVRIPQIPLGYKIVMVKDNSVSEQ